jgi:O-antigen ligase
LVLYGGVVSLAFLRMIFDQRNLEGFTTAGLLSEQLVNSVKWVIPGLILYDTCRTRHRVVAALLVVLGIYLLLAIQVIKWMPLNSVVTGDELSARAAKIIQNEVGYSRVNMSMMLAGGSWAIVAGTLLFKQWKTRTLMLGCATVVVLSQALTGGRTGYGVWALIGVLLGLLRWRWALPLVPVLALSILSLIPGVSERLFQGFGGRQGAIEVKADEYEITSGRTLIWPYVIDEIKKAPVFGYGQLAMSRIGLNQFLKEDLDEGFAHPHNAYLEMLLDNGIVGLLLVLPFYVLVIWHSQVLFRDRADDLSAAAGGVTLALVLALLIAAVGSQTFYPREGSVGMWAAIGLMLRVSVEKRKALEGGLFFEVATGAKATDEGGLGRPWRRVAAKAHGSWAARRGRPGFRKPVVPSGSAKRLRVKWPRTWPGDSHLSGNRRFVRNRERAGQK